MSHLPVAALVTALGLTALLPAAVHAEEITLHHLYGETVVDPDKVTRIVSVGYHEQDYLYALGLAPVGVHEWFGNKPYATWPWAEAARLAVGATPEVQKGMEIDVEWVWSMHPDLIVATFAPLDDKIYAQLAEIAPVIGPVAGYPLWGAPWDQELRLLGQATGRSEKAEAIISDLSARLAATTAAHPGLAGHSGTMAFFYDGQIVGYPARDGVNRLLASIGIETPAEFTDMAGTRGMFTVSPERIDLFDLDTLLWMVDAPARAAIEALPVWRNTRLAREGRAIWADETLTGAMSFQSPLSILWGLERLIPLLDQALDGDPATVVGAPN